MATTGRADFITVIPGPLSIYANSKIPGVSADQDRTVSKLRADLRIASSGSDVIFEAFAGLVSLGTVTVSAGSLSGETPIAAVVVAAGVQVTWKVNQVGSASAPGFTATLSARVD